MGVVDPERRLPATSVAERIETLRLAAGRRATAEHKSEMGQFLTPLPVARLMASMLECNSPNLQLLDAGAGVGSLFAAAVDHFLCKPKPPASIAVTAYEMDSLFVEALDRTMGYCREACLERGVQFSGDVITKDFIKDAADQLEDGLFGAAAGLRFNCAILNPPYRKIKTDSETRRQLRRMGLETSNLYTGFVAAAIQRLECAGEIVAITPRSFCNGPYFRPFRQFLLAEMAIQRVHVFASRKTAFKDDEVLQENVIMHAVRGVKASQCVTITSGGGRDTVTSSRQVRRKDFVQPNDRESFIHIAPDKAAHGIAARMSRLKHSLGGKGTFYFFRLRSDHGSGTPVELECPLFPPNAISTIGRDYPRCHFARITEQICGKEMWSTGCVVTNRVSLSTPLRS